MKVLACVAGAGLLLALAGCGGGGSGVNAPTVQPAAVYKLTNFQPAGPIVAGKPVKVSFTIRQPDGTPLTKFKTGAGPHTGVHLIFVRDDLAYIVHKHPPVGGAARIAETDHLPGARAVPARHRRLPGVGRPAGQLELPALREGRRQGRLQAAAAPADLDDPGAERLPVHAPRRRRPEGGPGAARDRRRHRARRREADVHAVVRRPRARDLLPQGQPRLLPYPRLRARGERLHERPRRRRRSPAPRPRRGSSTSGCSSRRRARGGCSCRPRSTGRSLTVPFTLHVH